MARLEHDSLNADERGLVRREDVAQVMNVGKWIEDPPGYEEAVNTQMSLSPEKGDWRRQRKPWTVTAVFEDRLLPLDNNVSGMNTARLFTRKFTGEKHLRSF